MSSGGGDQKRGNASKWCKAGKDARLEGGKKIYGRDPERQIKLSDVRGKEGERTKSMMRCGTGNDERSEKKIDGRRGDREANKGGSQDGIATGSKEEKEMG